MKGNSSLSDTQYILLGLQERVRYKSKIQDKGSVNKLWTADGRTLQPPLKSWKTVNLIGTDEHTAESVEDKGAPMQCNELWTQQQWFEVTQ